MTVGFDYWQVISHYPQQMEVLSASLFLNGHDVHVVSAIGKDRIGTIAGEISKLWPMFNLLNVHEVVFDSPSESPQLKLAKCKELGITMFFDDREDVCNLLNAYGILAFHVARRDIRSNDLTSEMRKWSKPKLRK